MGSCAVGRVKKLGSDLDLHQWRSRFEREGLTTVLRLELRDLLSPRVSLRAPLRRPFGKVEAEEEVEAIRQLAEWDIVLSANHVHGSIRELADRESWVSALPTLLTEFTWLLRDVLDLMRALGGADDTSDLSYVSWPSICEHAQNWPFRDWTTLIELNRDAWQATAAVSPEQALLAAEVWSQLPYPLFRRLAFFAAAQNDIVPPDQGLGWLLDDDHWWLWSVETQRETMRLLVVLAAQLAEEELITLEHAILAGPPRDMYRPNIEQARWTRIQESSIWLRLAKIRQAAVELGAAARVRLEEISAKHPDWQLASDEREEFPIWRGDAGELRVHVTIPRDRNELIQWLRDNPEPDDWRPDDWQERSRDEFDETASALAALAAEGIWPNGRWREALQQWSEDELRNRSWQVVAPVLVDMPAETLQALSQAVSWWLKKQASTFEGQDEVFLALCDRVLALDYEVEEEDDDLVGCAINHPVGRVTEGLLRWWYRRNFEDRRGLDDETRRVFTDLCDTEVSKFRHGRVLLATHVISLFRVDRKWTVRFLLPHFEWKNSEAEARAAWKGFLWSPRLYAPLVELLRTAFLEMANHYIRFGQHREQYASLLTFAGLDLGDVFGKRELALAMRALPQDALDHAADTFFRAVDSAGDRRVKYWRNRAAPYLKANWPNTRDVVSESVSESFAEACIAAGDAFPEALAQVSAWLHPLRYPGRVAHSVREAQLDARYPESALKLLDRVVGDANQGYFDDMERCLSAVRNAQPELRSDHRFRRLLDIVRENGGNLN